MNPMDIRLLLVPLIPAAVVVLAARATCLLIIHFALLDVLERLADNAPFVSEAVR